LPFRNPAGVMLIEDRWLPRFAHFETRPQQFQAWQAQSRAFDELAAFANLAFNLTSDSAPERIAGVRVSANLPSLLGVNPILGRTFNAQDDREGNDRVVLLGHSLWQRRFAGDPQIVGRALILNSISFTIIG